MDFSPPSSSIHGISQARILEWVAIPFSRGIFPTQGLNPGFLQWQVDFWPSEPTGKPWYLELAAANATAKSLQSCPTLCDPLDGSPPGSAVPGILQTRTLEWVAISFSNAWKWKVKVKSLSHVTLVATPWTGVSPIHGIFQARVLEWGAIAFISEKIEGKATHSSILAWRIPCIVHGGTI